MFHTRPVNLLDFVLSIASAIDLIDQQISHHHKRVAYVANRLARELGLAQKSQYQIVLAGLLHDIGALSSGERQLLAAFDSKAESRQHCEIGYQLLNKFKYFADVSTIIRHHHTDWPTSQRHPAGAVPIESQLLFLADRIDALIDKSQPILEQVEEITARIVRNTGTQFDPAHVDAFTELAAKEHFWLDITSPSLEYVLVRSCSSYSIELEDDDLVDFASLLAQIIDFRSEFTATHSSGVASVASVLAHVIGFSVNECQKVQVAGYLHDIGKLAIPSEILEKGGKLTAAEYRVIKSHAYHTYRILEPLQGLDEIRAWASMHHERLDGNGYPGRYSDRTIPLGARIIAAADVFTALLEERPYRRALGKEAVIAHMEEMARRHRLDHKLVAAITTHFDDIDTYRCRAQAEAKLEYARFRQSLERLSA